MISKSLNSNKYWMRYKALTTTCRTSRLYSPDNEYAIEACFLSYSLNNVNCYCHSGFCNSGSDPNVHFSGESAPQVGELINNFQFLSIQFCPFTVLVGSLYGFPGVGFCTTSVFFVLIVRSYIYIQSHDCDT